VPSSRAWGLVGILWPNIPQTRPWHVVHPSGVRVI